MKISTLQPTPPHFQPEKVSQVWRVPYQQRAVEAQKWAKNNQISPAGSDSQKVGLLLIDVQNTFCLPEFELFVAGKSGRGAIEDNERLCQFIYRHLDKITTIIPTLDTHTTTQIFHPIFWVNQAGEHPTPAATNITLEDVQTGRWQINSTLAASLTNGDINQLQQYALHYVKQLSDDGKYPLTVWPYHSMLGGIGHALVSAVEEAIFFHSIARQTQTLFEIKGNNPLTENYSVLKPEVLTTPDGNPLAQKNTALINKLLQFDALIIAGQAKSHCVAWTVQDLLTEIEAINPQFTNQIYLLEDCTSPVVVAGVIDFTEEADAAFQRFASAGMHLVSSTEPWENWPGLLSKNR